MLDVWPTTLPQELSQRGFQGKQRGPIRTPVDSGPMRTRRRSTLELWDIRGSMTLTAAQLTIFNAFLKTTLLDGSKSFTWKNPFDSTVSVTMTLAEDVPIVSVGAGFRITLTMEMQL